MAWVPSNDLAAALAGDHQMSARVTVVNQQDMTVTDIPASGGSVAATLANRVTRTANLTVDRGITDSGLLDPLRDLVVIRTGVAGVGEVPLFTGRVVDSSDTSGGDVQVHCRDRGHDIAVAAFEQPWTTTPGAAARDEIARIIHDVDSTWGVALIAAPATAVPALVWEEDRGKALDDVAAAINCLLQGDRTGGWVLYPTPFSLDPVDVQVTARITDGEGGALVKVTHTRSGEKIYNAVTVVVERTDNTAPLRVTVRDTGATSITRWGGPFGKRNRVVKVRTPLDLAGATALATRILNQSLALARSWRISLPHAPLHDPGDVIAVTYHGEVTTQVVESVRHNLRAADTTELTTRQLAQAAADTTT